MLQLRVEAIRQELPDVATFYLKEVSGKKISYKAGQFITLVFTHHDEEIRRSYSLSSSPDEELLSITVKRIANGEISRFLLTKVKAGDVLNAVEPAGRFVLNDADDDKLIFLFAAGSGIVPVYAQLKYALGKPGKSKFLLVYSNINPETILFKNELKDLALLHPDRLRINHHLSSEGDRLNNLLVEQLVKKETQQDYSSSEFYCCGPFAYMRMIRMTLLFIGVDASQIRKENFVVETIPVSETPFNYPPKNIKIHFKGELHDLVVGENQSILQAALQNNIRLPYSCRVGECSACAAICKSGKVEMVKNNVLTDADLKEGWILTCTGHPVSDDIEIGY